jgi:xanthosine utilization system XapX-like protein
MVKLLLVAGPDIPIARIFILSVVLLGLFIGFSIVQWIWSWLPGVVG